MSHVFKVFVARVLTRVWGRGETINTVYSTAGTKKGSVQDYSDGKTYYTVLFLKKKFLLFFGGCEQS